MNKQCGMGKSFSGTPEKVLPVRIKELVYRNVYFRTTQQH